MTDEWTLKTRAMDTEETVSKDLPEENSLVDNEQYVKVSGGWKCDGWGLETKGQGHLGLPST